MARIRRKVQMRLELCLHQLMLWKRLFADLSTPRSASRSAKANEEASVEKGPPRPPDFTRLAALASPRLEVSMPEAEPPPKKPKKKRKGSKHRIIAMVQSRHRRSQRKKERVVNTES